jgi:hypothetical protein
VLFCHATSHGQPVPHNFPYYLRFTSFSWASSKSSLTYKHSTMNSTMA